MKRFISDMMKDSFFTIQGPVTRSMSAESLRGSSASSPVNSPLNSPPHILQFDHQSFSTSKSPMLDASAYFENMDTLTEKSVSVLSDPLSNFEAYIDDFAIASPPYFDPKTMDYLDAENHTGSSSEKSNAAPPNYFGAFDKLDEFLLSPKNNGKPKDSQEVNKSSQCNNLTAGNDSFDLETSTGEMADDEDSGIEVDEDSGIEIDEPIDRPKENSKQSSNLIEEAKNQKLSAVKKTSAAVLEEANLQSKVTTTKSLPKQTVTAIKPKPKSKMTSAKLLPKDTVTSLKPKSNVTSATSMPKKTATSLKPKSNVTSATSLPKKTVISLKPKPTSKVTNAKSTTAAAKIADTKARKIIAKSKLTEKVSVKKQTKSTKLNQELNEKQMKTTRKTTSKNAAPEFNMTDLNFHLFGTPNGHLIFKKTVLLQ